MSGVSNFFTDLNPEDKRTNIISTVSAPLWSNGVTNLNDSSTGFYTSSVQSGSSGNYYYDVYDKAGTDSTREVQFAVAYGHRDGKGSLSTSVGNNPTKAIYSQFRNIAIQNPNSNTQFNFNANGESSTNYLADDIWVININRARYREKMDPGNWELHLSGSTLGSGISVMGQKLKLIDDSGATADSTIRDSQRVFNVVSGSISSGTSVTPEAHTAVLQTAIDSAGSYGYFYPELGVIVLNANAISSSTGLSLPRSTDSNDNSAQTLWTAIEGGNFFQARREEQIKSSHYFCRVESGQYNWSQNPTYYTGSNGNLTNPTFIQNPKSYITTVGLYNDNNELLAVAKLSQPLLKSQDREAVIKVRLDF
ncbi:hypothetical protein CMI47_16455 [Candidatus Pacearchaeota archaeon]|nr:hypothetical protein [Candidatus Pacearchaeota archaeon]